MKNIQILKEIIEAVEKHSEFEVKNFDSNTAASKNDEEIFFNIKFCLRKKEIVETRIPEVPAVEILPAGPGPKEENQSEEPVPGEEFKTEPAEISPEEVSEIPEPCCEEEEIPKKKKKNADKKKCVDCVNCYNDDGFGEFKCCKGNKTNISEYTSATFCDDYFARR